VSGAAGRIFDSSQPQGRSDVALPRDTNVTEAFVPANATLETLLQQNGLPAAIVAGSSRQSARSSTRAN
jgi:hypothetical protein